MSSESQLLVLLRTLKAVHWFHWTSHWKVQGETFYGDHLLFQRLYESVETEIDTLAEKMVGMYGPGIIQPVDLLVAAGEHLRLSDRNLTDRIQGLGNLYEQALEVETSLLQILVLTYEELKGERDRELDLGHSTADRGLRGLTLGMDDFLMATANAHESNTYLLKQRLSQSTPSAARVAAEFNAGYGGDPYWVTAKYPGKDRDGKPFAKGEKVFYYPKTKTFLTGEKAEKASREFESAREDENY